MLVSRTYKASISCLIILLVAAVPVQAKEWRGIVPLHSTRADVERLLGPPSTDRSDVIFYKFERESVSFHFAKGPCGVEPEGWNVPLGTVTSIWVIPKPNLLKLTDLKLGESKYIKERNDHILHIVNYINGEEGISYQVDTSNDGMITLIKFFPAAKDEYLRCPPSGEELEDTAMFDLYSDIPFGEEKKRLDSFAEQIRRHDFAEGYIMVYAGRRARAGEAGERATRAKEYLVKVRGTDVRRIVTKDGGHREKLTVELYLVPLGARPPLPTPTVDPNEVEIIKTTHALNNNRHATRPRCTL